LSSCDLAAPVVTYYKPSISPTIEANAFWGQVDCFAVVIGHWIWPNEGVISLYIAKAPHILEIGKDASGVVGYHERCKVEIEHWLPNSIRKLQTQDKIV